MNKEVSEIANKLYLQIAPQSNATLKNFGLDKYA